MMLIVTLFHGPVSYTHLSPHLHENRKEPGADREAAEANAGGMRMEQEVIFNGQILTPVSYTHLDVYKRQELRLCEYHVSLWQQAILPPTGSVRNDGSHVGG